MSSMTRMEGTAAAIRSALSVKMRMMSAGKAMASRNSGRMAAAHIRMMR